MKKINIIAITSSLVLTSINYAIAWTKVDFNKIADLNSLNSVSKFVMLIRDEAKEHQTFVKEIDNKLMNLSTKFKEYSSFYDYQTLYSVLKSPQSTFLQNLRQIRNHLLSIQYNDNDLIANGYSESLSKLVDNLFTDSFKARNLFDNLTLKCSNDSPRVVSNRCLYSITTSTIYIADLADVIESLNGLLDEIWGSTYYLLTYAKKEGHNIKGMKQRYKAIYNLTNEWDRERRYLNSILQSEKNYENQWKVAANKVDILINKTLENCKSSDDSDICKKIEEHKIQQK